LVGNGQVSVRDGGGQEQRRVSAAQIIIATGSAPARIPPAVVDQNRIVDSTGALAFSEVPQTLGIIGAGVIGLELGSVWRRLGAKVTVLEAMPDFLSAADVDVSREALKLFKRQGLDIRLGARVISTECRAGEVEVHFEVGDKTEKLAFERLIVSVGRSPRTEGLGAAETGLELDARGFIKVDGEFRTNLPGVRAIGDVIGGPMLAHKASEEGVAVAELLAGQKPQINHAHVPWVIYTWPEIAWAGATEQALKAAGVESTLKLIPGAGHGGKEFDSTESRALILAFLDKHLKR
jgi:dihydrolipoamide dehydrogenase